MILHVMSVIADDIYLGGYADFKGVAEPLTVHIAGGGRIGGVAATFVMFAMGMILDHVTQNNVIWDRIACVIYYASAVSGIAFFGLSKPIQALATGLDIKGQAIDGALLCSLLALVAHLYLLSALLPGVDALAKLHATGTAWLGLGAQRKTWINKKLLFRAIIVAVTLPLSRGFVGYVFGLTAQLATFGTLKAASVFMAILGAQ